MLFAIGVKIVVQGELGYREGLVVGIAFLAGVGAQYGVILPEEMSRFAGGLLENGMNAGGFSAILMTLFLRLTGPARSRLRTALDPSHLPRIRGFLRDFAARSGWGEAMSLRLGAVAEEALLALAHPEVTQPEAPRARHPERPSRLLLTAHRENDGAVLEFIVGTGEENLEDRVALLGDPSDEAAIEREVLLRLLRHMAASVRHQQYHDTEVVTVRVEAVPD